MKTTNTDPLVAAIALTLGALTMTDSPDGRCCLGGSWCDRCVDDMPEPTWEED